DRLSTLAKANAFADRILNGETLFGSDGLDLGAIYGASLGSDAARAYGRFDAIRQWGGNSRAMEAERLESVMAGLRSAFVACGLDYDPADSRGLPSMLDVATALGSDHATAYRKTAGLVAQIGAALSSAPAWVATELEAWTDSLLDYSAARLLMANLKPDADNASLELEAEQIQSALLDSIASGTEPDEQLVQKLRSINAFLSLGHRYEALLKAKQQDDELGREHWRQYLLRPWFDDAQCTPLASELDYCDESITLRSAESWYEGAMLDASKAADARNAACSMAIQSWVSSTGPDAGLGAGTELAGEWDSFMQLCESLLADPSAVLGAKGLYTGRSRYLDEYNRARGEWATIELSAQELRLSFADAAKSWEDNSNTDMLKERLAQISARLEEARTEYEQAMSAYSESAQNFSMAGSDYDQLCGQADALYTSLENARLELETQEAVRSWASTAYLACSGEDAGIAPKSYRDPHAELLYARSHLAASGVALDALSSMYDGLESMPYADTAYQKLFEAYRDEYARYLLASRAKSAIEATLRDEYENRASQWSRFLDLTQGCSAESEPFAQDLSYTDYEEICDGSYHDTGWTDLLSIDDQGRLCFSRDGYALKLIDSQQAEKLSAYFDRGEGDYKTSAYQSALAQLCARLSAQTINRQRIHVLALARDHLMQNLVRDPGFASRFSQASALNGGWPRQADKLYSTVGGQHYGVLSSTSIADYLDDFREPEYRLVVLDSFPFAHVEFGQLAKLREDAWNSLDAGEQADLEFLIVLSLSGAGAVNSINDALSDASEYEEYTYVQGIMERWVRRKQNSWFGLGGLCGADDNFQAILSSDINAPLKAIVDELSAGANDLASYASAINESYQAFSDTNKRIAELEGSPPDGRSVLWVDLAS
ncbi:MAG TPA: hypothetical protein PLC54_03075, partial [Spirochaetales bacterium]|nr:hypothetical protein [Spirochaetales bacterium]